MSKLKNFLKKNYQKLAVFALGATYFTVGAAVHAAADADYASGTQQILNVATDNKATTIGFVVGAITVSTIIVLIIRAAFFGKGQAVGVFGGRRKKR
jgi:hypothetical protein